MYISVDGGALCSKTPYGTTIFSSNLIYAIQQYELQNEYTVYTFCNIKPSLQSKQLQFKTLNPKKGWMKVRVSLEELFFPKQIFLALNQALPFYSSGNIITFSHGLSFQYFPDLYRNEYARLNKQLDEYLIKSKFIIVSSERIRQELTSYNSSVKKIIKVIPFGIPYDCLEYKKETREDFVLFVGNNQPIKQVNKLVTMCQEQNKKLVLVGPFNNLKSKQVIVYDSIERKQLIRLYRKAACYVSLSKYESFNFPVLEALSQQCPVAALESAIIPEMKPFVNSYKTVEEVVLTQKNTKKVDCNKVKEIFSWEQYVHELSALYNKI